MVGIPGASKLVDGRVILESVNVVVCNEFIVVVETTAGSELVEGRYGDESVMIVVSDGIREEGCG